MKVCFLGVTGNMGRRLVQGALARGHDVTALTRENARRGPPPHERLTVRRVSFDDGVALTEAMRGHDVIINAAGYLADGEGYTPLIARIIGAASAALGSGGRFWLFGGAAALDVPGLSLMTMDLTILPKVFEAHRANWNVVRASQLDWSMLCPGPMIDSPDGRITESLQLSAESWPVAAASLHLCPTARGAFARPPTSHVKDDDLLRRCRAGHS